MKSSIRTLFWIEATIQLALGSIMMIAPWYMQRLIHTPEPNLFIQAIGTVALSMALLAILAAQKSQDSSLAVSAAATLAVFNFGLAVFLGLAASQGLISWLGILVHAPFAIAFCYATLVLRKGSK